MQLRIERWHPSFAAQFSDVAKYPFRVVGFADSVPAGSIGAEDAGGALVVRHHFVDEGFRNLGLGGMLLDELVLLGAELGFQRIEAAVPPGDRIAKLTYESAKFKAVRIVLCRELLPG